MQKEPHRSGFPKSMQLSCRAFRINPKAQLLFMPLCQDRQQQRESAGCNQNGDMQCAFSCLWRSRNVLPLRQRNSFLDRCLCRNIGGSRCRRLRAVVCCMISVCGNGRGRCGIHDHMILPGCGLSDASRSIRCLTSGIFCCRGVCRCLCAVLCGVCCA